MEIVGLRRGNQSVFLICCGLLLFSRFVRDGGKGDRAGDALSGCIDDDIGLESEVVGEGQ